MKICTIAGCGKPFLAKGLCGMHYARKQRFGTTDLTLRAIQYDPVCTVSGCGAASKARGLCNKHYLRQWLRGSTAPTRNSDGPIAEKFPIYVDKNGPQIDYAEGRCWQWTGRTDGWGYGRVEGDGRHEKAHRASYELHVGPIPKGLWVLHHCDNQSCVNPAHLFLGTAKHNTDDMLSKGRDRLRGEDNGMAKLLESDVVDIRSDPTSQTEVAQKHGISQAHISRIKARVSWRHVV